MTRGDVYITDVLGTPTRVLESWTPDLLGPNLIHWWDARANVSYDTGSGRISQWVDSANALVAAQTTEADRPIYVPSAREVRFTNDQSLTLPGMSRAYAEHHWYCFVFRVNWSAITGTDGSFFAVNGYSGGNQRQPAGLYAAASSSLTSIWRASPNANALSLPAEGDEVWHVAVGRRTPDGVYLTIDGEEETFLSCNPSMNLPNIGIETPEGILGDFRANDIEFSIDSLCLGQRDLDSQEIAKLQGWAMWRLGEESRLPESHPYVDEPPPIEDALVEEPDGEDATAYPSFDWSAGDFVSTHRAEVLDRTDLVLTFEEEWDDIDGITDGAVGSGPWYTPARSDTSAARFRTPFQTFNPFSVDTPSVLTITMQKPVSTWFSGHVQTVNTFGEGFSQQYGLFEARLAFEDVPVAWPAFWLYSVENQYKNTTATRAEIDVLECYATDPDGYHAAIHRHPAVREQPGHLDAHTSYGEIEQLGSGGNPAIWGITDLFDGNFHTYGCLISSTLIIMYIDDKEVSRAPMYPEADVPLHLLLSLQMPEESVDIATSPVRMYCDWVRVWEVGDGGPPPDPEDGFGEGGFGEGGFGE